MTGDTSRRPEPVLLGQKARCVLDFWVTHKDPPFEDQREVDLLKVAGPAGEPSASVLLVHGLGGHAYDTWRCGAGKQADLEEAFWPRWLVDDCETLAVYVISYDAPVSRLRGTANRVEYDLDSTVLRPQTTPTAFGVILRRHVRCLEAAENSWERQQVEA